MVLYNVPHLKNIMLQKSIYRLSKDNELIEIITLRVFFCIRDMTIRKIFMKTSTKKNSSIC